MSDTTGKRDGDHIVEPNKMIADIDIAESKLIALSILFGTLTEGEIKALIGEDAAQEWSVELDNTLGVLKQVVAENKRFRAALVEISITSHEADIRGAVEGALLWSNTQ